MWAQEVSHRIDARDRRPKGGSEEGSEGISEGKGVGRTVDEAIHHLLSLTSPHWIVMQIPALPSLSGQ